MINEEEFGAFCNAQNRELADEKKRQGKFIKDVERSLIKLSFSLFPEFKSYKKQWKDALKREAHESAVNMNEFLDYMVCLTPDDSNENPEQYKVPNFDTAESEKNHLESMLRILPVEKHANFIKENDERVAFEKQERDFMFACHYLMKEKITFYFPEIIDLSGNSIRNINFTAYCTILNYKTAFLYLAFYS